jgi:hypothetical protein
VKELSTLATAYSAGELTPEQADEAHSRYYHRWGEALPGASAADGVSDGEIIGKIDKARPPFTTPQESAQRYLRSFNKPSGGQSR